MSSGPGNHVVIVGSGFGGLFAARALAGAAVRVTLIDRTNHHLFQPLLYQVATGILSTGEIAPPTRDVLRHQTNITVLQGEVHGVDAPAQRLTVLAADGHEREVGFDRLIAATGFVTSYFGHDEFREHTLAMKTLDDAMALRERIFSVLERAAWERDPQKRRRQLTFAVVGGGATGVELAGQIGELSRRSLEGNFRDLDPREIEVILLDGGERILPGYTERQSARAAAALEAMGVQLRLRCMVSAVDEHGLNYRGPDGEEHRLEAATRVWAAGVASSPFARELARATGAPTTRDGRLKVLEDCSVPGFPHIFAVGDMMALRDLPGLAEVAMQTGRHAARMVQRDLAGQPRLKFRYIDLGSMAAVSRTSAVASFHRLNIAGLPGWLMWLGVHLFFLTGFKNRVTTVIHWGVTFLGRGRSERALLGVGAEKLADGAEGSARRLGG